MSRTRSMTPTMRGAMNPGPNGPALPFALAGQGAAEKLQLKLDGIAARGVCYLVQEGLKHPCMGVVSGRAQRPNRHIEGDARSLQRIVGHEAGGKRIGTRHRKPRKILVTSEAREVVVPRSKLSMRIHPGRQIVVPAGTIKIML